MARRAADHSFVASAHGEGDWASWLHRGLPALRQLSPQTGLCGPETCLLPWEAAEQRTPHPLPTSERQSPQADHPKMLPVPGKGRHSQAKPCRAPCPQSSLRSVSGLPPPKLTAG